ncbi:MAG TPA: MlaD family protein [Longimicrobiaceae bacterium]|nr:MlaD family protein [Longimicrobiaceae bacterium]
MRFKNEVIVGIVVVLSIIVLVAGAYWLSGKPFGQEEREITAVFSQVGQLRPGNPVVYRGVSIGRISSIELVPEGNGVLVGMQIAPDVQLPPDMAVVLSPQSLFGDWMASLVSERSSPELDFARIPTRPDVLPGAALPDISELTAVAARIASDVETFSDRFQLAFTEETAIKVRQTVENVQEISAQLTGFVEQQTATFNELAGTAVAASENIRTATATVERVASQVETTISEGEVQQILTNVSQASETLRQMSLQFQEATGGIPRVVARADTTLAAVGQLSQDLGAILGELEPTIAEVGPTLAEARVALATLQRAGERLENGEGTLGRLLEDPALYEEIQASIGSLRRLMADIQADPARYLRNVKIGVF